MNWAVIFLLTIGALLGLFLSANAVDVPFQIHGLIFAVPCVLAVFGVVRFAFGSGQGRVAAGSN
jgi:hypothetical protein